MSNARLFCEPRVVASPRGVAPVALPCGQLPLALVGALCGPQALRAVRKSGAQRVVLDFSHRSIGQLQLSVAVNDARAHETIRHLRCDRNAYARVLAVLARAVELDGQPGR